MAQLKSNSYSKVFFVVATVLGSILLIILWQVEVNDTSFIRNSVWKTMIAVIFFISFPALFTIKRWGKGTKPQSILDNLKLYAGLLLFLSFFGYILLITMVKFLPGPVTIITAQYHHVTGGGKGCSGVQIFEPELLRSINVCRPSGNLFRNNTIKITKRSNILGIVVLSASTSLTVYPVSVFPLKTQN